MKSPEKEPQKEHGDPEKKLQVSLGKSEKVKMGTNSY